MASAAQAATSTGTASVTLSEAPLSVTETGNGIQFGLITPSNGGDAQNWFCFTNYAPADHFTVTGQPYSTIVFTTPDSATLTGPEGFTLQITTFYNGDPNTPSSNTGAQTYTLSNTGSYTVGVCGVLSLPGEHIPPGEYTGTFQVTADYQ